MFLSNCEHYNFIDYCLQNNPHEVCITTYGVYAGITYDGRDTTTWGDKYKSHARDILDRLQNARILVGIGEYKSCGFTKSCMNCERQYIKNLFRLAFHADKFTIQWRITYQLPFKGIIFDYTDHKTSVVGGRNLSDVPWDDITFEPSTTDTEKLYNIFCESWESAMILNDETINAVLKSQQISTKSIDSFIEGDDW